MVQPQSPWRPSLCNRKLHQSHSGFHSTGLLSCFSQGARKAESGMAGKVDCLCRDARSHPLHFKSAGWSLIEFCRDLKSRSGKAILRANRRFIFPKDANGYHVWQQSFKAKPLWSAWMIKQKIDYIHANPVKARLVKSAKDYFWSSFRSFYRQDNLPLAVDIEWWWPDDSEKLSKAMKRMGWHSYWVRDKKDGK